MVEKNLISIIIPCYNCEKNLFRSVESVLQQDYQKLELILVDDGSEDNTLEVAKNYAKLDSRIKVVAAKHAGVSSARNSGLKKSNGEYIAFVDSDDNYTTPSALSTMLNSLKKYNADRCVCNFTHPCFEQHIPAGIYDLTQKKDFLTYYKDFFAFGMPWNKLTRRECLTELFDTNLKLGEDEIYNLANLKNLKKVVVINDVLYNYFCTPFIPSNNASAITKTVSEQGNKVTVWHMFMRNQSLREKIILQDFSSIKDEMLYVRAFDFFFWVFFLMAKNRFSVSSIINNYCLPVFSDSLFQKAIENETGLNSIEWKQPEIEKYCKFAYYAYADIHLFHRNLSLYHVFLCIMAKVFITKEKQIKSDTYLSEMNKALNNNLMPEAIYVNRLFGGLLSGKEQESEQNEVLNLWLSGGNY